MRERAPPKKVTGREQPAALLRRDPVDASAQPRLKRHALPRLQEQGVEEEHAELAIADPRLAFPERLERADVDEDGLRPEELDVVRRRVLEHEPCIERPPDELELEQGRVPEHAERPFVGVRDEREHVVLEHGRDRLGETVGREWAGLVDLASSDELPFGYEVREERSGGEGAPIGETLLGEEAEDAAGPDDDAAVGISEGARLEVGDRKPALLHVASRARQPEGPSSSGLPIRRTLFRRLQYNLATTAPAATPPAIIWSRRLPEPGSM
jgi:hypothetical protein